MELNEARELIPLGIGNMYRYEDAANLVLEHAENMESRARALYEKADPGERRDAVLENIRTACRYILGETDTVGLAHRLVERNAQ